MSERHGEEGPIMTTRANAQPDARKDALDALGSSGYGLCIVLLLSGEFLILSMLDELVFHSQPPYLPGWILWIVLEVVMTVLICRVIWIVRHGGRVGAFQESAAGRARARKTRIVFAVGLSAVLIAAYGVHFVDRKQVMAGEKERAAATLSAIETSFEDAGFYAYGDLPIAVYDPAGYSMIGALYMDEGDQNTQVRVNVDNEGVVAEVIYDMDVDPALPLEDNLVRAEASLDAMHEAVSNLDVPFEQPGLASYGALPEPFCQAFLAGSPYEEIIMHPSDLGSSEGAYIHAAFWTFSEEDWIDNLGASIQLQLECDG